MSRDDIKVKIDVDPKLERGLRLLAMNHIIVEHARADKTRAHVHFIIFLLAVIAFCLVVLVAGVK